MKTSHIRLLLCSFMLAFVTVGPALAQTQRGSIKAVAVTGAVTRLAADGSTHALANNTLLTESDTVVTAAGSSVVLVFMNGSTVRLGANSRLAVEEFKMDPLADAIEVARLKAEPSVSQTTLSLAYGELVGDVKTLNKTRGSNFSVKTPVGAAGIRGTTFRIVFTPAPDGKTFNFALSTAEGVVLFTGTAATAPVEVAQGKEVVVVAEVNTATGEVANVQVQSQAISAEATREIESAVTQAIQQAQAEAVFTREEQASAASAASDTTETSKTGSPRDEERSSPVPQPEIEAPQTTTPQPVDPSTVSRSG